MLSDLTDILQAEQTYARPPEPPKKRKARKKEAEGPPVRYTSFHAAGGILYEQVVGPDGRCAFLAYEVKTGKTETVKEIPGRGEIIRPNDGEEVTLGAVKLPSSVEEYGETRALLSEIEAHIKKYLDISSTFLRFTANYVALTWLYDRFPTLPYLRVLGDTGCGKSRFLDVIGGLSYKSISASGCITPAPIYRMLKKWGGTLILDEADLKNSNEYSEVVKILNCGFEKGRPVHRAVKDDPDKVQTLPVYGPKIFATRRRFQDVALEARCLTEIMEETDRDDIPPVLGRRFYEEQQLLRHKLLLYRFRNYYRVDPEAGAGFKLPGFEPRLRQVSEAFISLFANEPDELNDFILFLANHQRELIEQRAGTKTGQVVEALFRAEKDNRVTTVMGLSLIDVTPKDIAVEVGMTPQGVGQILKGLGLSTHLTKIGGVAGRRIVYDEAKLKKLRKRYILDEEAEETPPEPRTLREPLEVPLGEPLFELDTSQDVKKWPFCEGCGRKVPSVDQQGLCPDCEAINE